MKSLSNYVTEAQTKLFNETGTFFAFSQSQFKEKEVEGVQYVSLGAGMVCPKQNATKVHEGLALISKQGRAQDLVENGKDAIIVRELHNYECFYQWDIEDAVDALSDYGITRAEVQAVFDRVAPTVEC